MINKLSEKKDADKCFSKCGDQSVAIEYKYRVTHPPDVVWAEDEKKVSRFGGGFLVKKEDFTKNSITLPTYDIKYTVPDFAFDRKP
ncbi:hypothetical protein TNCV_1610091 [Trichonephila clavipes]|nr:hypothetical protein TNCV_1610091 [Trichonephila clavipes]